MTQAKAQSELPEDQSPNYQRIKVQGSTLKPRTANWNPRVPNNGSRGRWRTIPAASCWPQSAVCLHMVATQQADIPVVLIDTGYLFPETYRFIDELSERLSLNLGIYRAELSPAWQEARYGKLWEQGLEGIERY